MRENNKEQGKKVCKVARNQVRVKEMKKHCGKIRKKLTKELCKKARKNKAGYKVKFKKAKKDASKAAMHYTIKHPKFVMKNEAKR